MSNALKFRHRELRPPSAAAAAGSAGSGRRPASGPRRSSTAACSTASRRTPGASPAPRRRWPSPGSARRRTRRPRPAAARSPGRTRRPAGRPPSPWPPAAGGRSRSRSSAVSPGATVSWYQNAHLVPVRSGLTVAAPLTTWSLMPSLGYGVSGAEPNSRWSLVSFSQNSAVGWVRPARAGEQLQRAEERVLDAHRRLTGRPHGRLGRIRVPGPGVAEPRGRQHVQRRRRPGRRWSPE